MNQGLTSRELKQLNDLLVKANVFQIILIGACVNEQYKRQKRYENESATNKGNLRRFANSIK